MCSQELLSSGRFLSPCAGDKEKQKGEQKRKSERLSHQPLGDLRLNGVALMEIPGAGKTGRGAQSSALGSHALLKQACTFVDN